MRRRWIRSRGFGLVAALATRGCVGSKPTPEPDPPGVRTISSVVRP
jgi:hypothetical protein